MIELTLFSNIFDVETEKQFRFNDFERFSSALFKMSTKEMVKPRRGRKTNKDAPLISPAVYPMGSRRCNENVLRWGGWAALDVDDYDVSFEESLNAFSNYEYLCYSSASSTKAHPRYRVVFPLTEPVQSDKIRHFWYALNKEFGNLGDAQAKDLSRMYYVPGQYPNAYNFIFSANGKYLNPNELMSRHDFVEPNKDFMSKLPVEMQRALIKERRNSLSNTSVQWSSYRDCPFVNSKMIEHYRSIAHTDGTGRYAYFYKLMLNIAGNAIRARYPITANEVVALLRELDAENGNRYRKRKLETEAARAIEYVLQHDNLVSA
jgi:hypothetical protein